MNYTNKTSVSYQIASKLFEFGPLSAERCASLLPEHSHKVVRTAIGKLCFAGDFMKSGELFDLAPNLKRHFAAELSEKTKCAPAEPRTFSVGRSLDLSRLPKLDGTREGSMDFRSWPSRFERLV